MKTNQRFIVQLATLSAICLLNLHLSEANKLGGGDANLQRDLRGISLAVYNHGCNNKPLPSDFTFADLKLAADEFNAMSSEDQQAFLRVNREGQLFRDFVVFPMAKFEAKQIKDLEKETKKFQQICLHVVSVVCPAYKQKLIGTPNMPPGVQKTMELLNLAVQPVILHGGEKFEVTMQLIEESRAEHTQKMSEIREIISEQDVLNSEPAMKQMIQLLNFKTVTSVLPARVYPNMDALSVADLVKIIKDSLKVKPEPKNVQSQTIVPHRRNFR